MSSNFVEGQRREAFDFGARLRDDLVRTFMIAEGSLSRPFLKDVVDVLIEEVLGVRIRTEVLPLDRYAQTEMVHGRPEISINSRVAQIPNVKHAAGIVNVAKWHEGVHAAKDFRSLAQPTAEEQPALPDFDAEVPRLIACRGFDANLTGEARGREFFAENAGLAAAICRDDLQRSDAFVELQSWAAKGGELGSRGWSMLYAAAEHIGVNPTALVTYLQHLSIIRVERNAGSTHLYGNPSWEADDGWG